MCVCGCHDTGRLFFPNAELGTRKNEETDFVLIKVEIFVSLTVKKKEKVCEDKRAKDKAQMCLDVNHAM